MDSQNDLRDAAKRGLVADVVRSFGQVRLKVTGTSMLPAVLPGDILTVIRRDGADLLPGQIVLCFRDEELIAHRLTGKSGNLFITRGDSLCHDDRSFREDEVLGQVVSILRDGLQIDPSPAWWHGAGRFVLRRSELSVRVLLGLKRLGGATKAGYDTIQVGTSSITSR
jgi:signal peptidase I